MEIPIAPFAKLFKSSIWAHAVTRLIIGKGILMRVFTVLKSLPISAHIMTPFTETSPV